MFGRTQNEKDIARGVRRGIVGGGIGLVIRYYLFWGVVTVICWILAIWLMAVGV